MVFKLHKTVTRGSSDGDGKRAQLDSGPAIRAKIIDFAVAKWVMDQAGHHQRQCAVYTEASSRLPNLAAEDWCDWTALCALFGAVALFPFLAMLLF